MPESGGRREVISQALPLGVWIKTLDISDKQKKKLGKVLYGVGKVLIKQDTCDSKKKQEKCEHRNKHRLDNILEKLSKTLEKFAEKGVLSKDEKDEITNIIYLFMDK